MSARAACFGLGHLGLGALIVFLAVPLLRRRVPPNGWYGIRIPAAFASEEAWYRINHHGGKSLLGMGAALGLAGLANLAFLPPHPPPVVEVLELLLPLLLLVPTLIHVWRYPRTPEGEPAGEGGPGRVRVEREVR